MKRRDGCNEERTALAVENAVFGLRGALDVVVDIGFGGHEFDSEIFREKKLAHMRGVTCGVGFAVGTTIDAHLVVDVVDATLIEAGEDGLESDGAFFAGELNSAEEGELIGGFQARRSTRSSSRSEIRRRLPGRALVARIEVG